MRGVSSGKKSMSLQEGTADEKQHSNTVDEFGQKRMGFFEAADVLSKPPVKPKRLGSVALARVWRIIRSPLKTFLDW